MANVACWFFRLYKARGRVLFVLFTSQQLAFQGLRLKRRCWTCRFFSKTCGRTLTCLWFFGSDCVNLDVDLCGSEGDTSSGRGRQHLLQTKKEPDKGQNRCPCFRSLQVQCKPRSFFWGRVREPGTGSHWVIWWQIPRKVEWWSFFCCRENWWTFRGELHKQTKAKHSCNSAAHQCVRCMLVMSQWLVVTFVCFLSGGFVPMSMPMQMRIYSPKCARWHWCCTILEVNWFLYWAGQRCTAQCIKGNLCTKSQNAELSNQKETQRYRRKKSSFSSEKCHAEAMTALVLFRWREMVGMAFRVTAAAESETQNSEGDAVSVLQSETNKRTKCKMRPKCEVVSFILAAATRSDHAEKPGPWQCDIELQSGIVLGKRCQKELRHIHVHQPESSLLLARAVLVTTASVTWSCQILKIRFQTHMFRNLSIVLFNPLELKRKIAFLRPSFCDHSGL